MRLNGKNVCQALLITLSTPYFQVLCDGLLLDGKTTAISKSPYYAWKICKIWWKVIAGRIWWWDEIERQKCAPSVINNVGHIPKNATIKSFTSTEFFNTHQVWLPLWGDIHFANKKRELLNWTYRQHFPILRGPGAPGAGPSGRGSRPARSRPLWPRQWRRCSSRYPPLHK